MEHKRRSAMNNASANASEAVALLKKATNNEDRLVNCQVFSDILAV